MPVTLLPTTELVAEAWLKTIASLPTDAIATALPLDETIWADTGFVQVQAITGGMAPDLDSPLNKPVVQVDFWASNGQSKRPPWNKVANMVELVRQETYVWPINRRVTLTGDYPDARVMSVYFVTEPRRMLADVSSYARYSVDMRVNWVTTVQIPAGV